MNILIALFWSFPVLFCCEAAVSKKYYNEHVQNQFTHFPTETTQNWSQGENTAEGIGKLTTSLLHEIYLRAGKRFNIVVSPVSVWIVLAMLLEGAGGRTENELKKKLQLSYRGHDEGTQLIRTRFRELTNLYKSKNSPTEFTALNFLISDNMKMIYPEYKNIIRGFYDGLHFEVDSRESERYSRMINMWANKATNNQIESIISPATLTNLVMVIGNAVHFKSKWKYPFDPSQTALQPFTDENEKVIKNVPMMNQFVVVPYVYNSYLECQIVEIPYADELTSMVVILPRERLSLASVLSRMHHLNLDEILPKNATEEPVQLSLPRFHLISKTILNGVLKQDLPSVFSSQHADFPRIGKNIFVSRVAHKAEIENTEEGTTASAVSSVQFAYKSSGIAFRANRPFVYLINEMKTRTVLFAGTYTNPFVG